MSILKNETGSEKLKYYFELRRILIVLSNVEMEQNRSHQKRLKLLN